MKKSFQILATSLMLCALFFTSCKKELEELIAPENIVSAEDDGMVQAEFSSLFDLIEVESPVDWQTGSRREGLPAQPACARRTWDAATRTLTLDFGTANCLGNDGLYRRGKVMAVFNGPRQTAGSSVTITLQNYYVNDNQLQGTKIITNLSQYKHRVQVLDAKLTTPEGAISWNADRTIERTSPENAICCFTYLVTGSSTGVNRQGISFTATITQPLKRVFLIGCARTFVSGKISIINDKGRSLDLNYDPIGGEPCDKIAEVTMNGRTKRITLR